MKKILTITVVSLSLTASAQEICGTRFMKDRLIETYPELDSIYRSQERVFEEMSSTSKQSSVVSIPVVFHVIWNTPEQQVPPALFNQTIDILTKDFRRQNPDANKTGQYGGYQNPNGLWPQNYISIAADCEIQFNLCDVTYDHTQYYQIDVSQNPYYLKTAFPYYQIYDPAKYLNVWVCNMNGSLLGLAEFPGTPPQHDGVTVTYTSIGYNSSNFRVLTHEVGHWLGLRHIWGDCACCDDYVNDTYPQQDNNNSMAAQPPFPNYPNQYPCAMWTACPGVNVYGGYYYPYVNMGDNYMDYSPSSCLNFFSFGQKQRMWYVLNNYRPMLLLNNPCDPAGINNATNNAIAIYPNPASSTINFSVRTNVRLTDITGQIVANQTNTTALDISGQSAGIYIVTLTDDEGRVLLRRKIVKE